MEVELHSVDDCDCYSTDDDQWRIFVGHFCCLMDTQCITKDDIYSITFKLQERPCSLQNIITFLSNDARHDILSADFAMKWSDIFDLNKLAS